MRQPTRLALAAAALLLGVIACARAPATPAPASTATPSVETPDYPIASDAVAESLLADLRTVDSRIVSEMRYAKADNFTGAPLPGYLANRAMLRREAAAALGRVQRRLAAQRATLLVWDAYRPVRATDAMVAWTRRAGREDLLRDGYIATRSRHNLGLAVDLTLIDLGSGKEYDMGTPFDTFTAAASTMTATGSVLNNRLLLKAAMEAEGFRNYDKEWWHYSYELPAGVQPLRFDLVIR